MRTADLQSAFRRAPIVEGASIFSGYFRSPHGVCIELIGELSTQSHVDASTVIFDSAERQSPALEELLELPGADNLEDEDQEEEYPEVEERVDAQELMLEPEYVDEIPDDELEAASGDALLAKLNIEENRLNSRVVPAEKPGSGYAPRSVPLNTLRQSQNLPRDGSTRWPASNDKRNGRSVFDEAEVDEL